MARKIPTTRYHLYKLTQRIERLEYAVPFVYERRGTGVKAMGRELDSLRRLRRQAADLRREKALVEAGLLKIQQRGSEALYALTKDGQIQVLKDRIRLEQHPLEDGRLCYVVFDIPEDVKKTRNAFRWFLKDAGFKQVQLSIWSTYKDVVADLVQLVGALKIGKWVKIIVGETPDTKYTTIVA